MTKKVMLLLLILVLGTLLLVSCRPPEVEGIVVNMKNGLYDKAFDLAKEAVQKYPENPEAWFYLGYLYSRKQNWDKMNEAFEKTLEINPQQMVTFEGQAVQADRAIQAIRLQSFADLYNSATANFNKARQTDDEQTQKKLYQAAYEKYLQATRVYPERVEPLRPLAVTALMLGDTTKAENFLEEAITRQPDNDTLMVVVADFYLSISKLDKAEALYKKALGSNPQYTDAYLALGQLYTMKKDWDKAVEFFKKSLELKPNNPDVLFNVGISYYNAEKYEEAIPFLKKTLELEPDNKDIYEVLAICYIQTERNKEALPFLEDAVKKYPNDGALWNYLAIVYSRLGMKEKAIEAFNKSKELEGM